MNSLLQSGFGMISTYAGRSRPKSDFLSICNKSLIFVCLFANDLVWSADPATTKADPPTPSASYPWRGLDGSGAAVDCGKPLVSSLSAARLVWKSEDRLPGAFNQPDLGGFCSPVVANGKVLVGYWEPTGAVYAENLAVSNSKTKLTPEQLAWLKSRYAIDANDVIHCFDAKTGKTLWRAVFKNKGINHGYSWYSATFMTPVVRDGKVFLLGTTARVYAVDLETGTTLWESHLGKGWETLEARKQRHLTEKSMSSSRRSDLNTVPAVADGIFASCDDLGALIGLDAKTGERLWRVDAGSPKLNYGPVRWSSGGKEYFWIAKPLMCIEPKTGKILWQDKISRPPGTTQIAISGDLLIQNCPRIGIPEQGIYCYRITPTEATLLWKYNGITCNYQTPLIYRGYLYIETSTGGSKHDPGRLACIDMRNGKEIDALPVPARGSEGACSSLVATDGMLLHRNVKPRDPNPMIFVKADPNDYRIVGESMPIDIEPWLTPAIVDGRMYVRLKNYLACYDLKQ